MLGQSCGSRGSSQIDARTCNYFGSTSKVYGFNSPCCRFGTGSRGGAVGDAVCAKAEQPKKTRSLTARGPLFFACRISAVFRVLRALRKQKSEPEAANNAGLLLCCCPCKPGDGSVSVRFGSVWFVVCFRFACGFENRFG